MRFVPRQIAPEVLEAARHYPAVVITGPRRAGKTRLLRQAFPQARYVLLEDPDLQARARSDPRGFLDELRPPVLFDEIQNVPELFDYVRTRIDRAPRKMGQWLFTGSQEAPLMRGVSESMAGRAAILQLLPFSVAETDRVSLILGGYPEVLAHPKGRTLWFASYIQTYLERDVRALLNIRDLPTFRRFLALLASRHGQILNKSDLAAPLGVSVPTVGEWLHVLEVTGQVILMPPYFENFGKRLIKSPKVYLGDSGMACHLLGIASQAELERSPFLGPLWEGFVAAEILKSQINQGRAKNSTISGTSRVWKWTSSFPTAADYGWWSAKHRKPSSPLWRGRWNRCAAPWATGHPVVSRWCIVHRPAQRRPAHWRRESKPCPWKISYGSSRPARSPSAN